MPSRRSPAAAPDPDQARAAADALLATLRQRPTATALKQARALLPTLRNLRQFDALLPLAEQLSRIDPADAPTRRLYAQGLIETGATTAALDMLRQLVARLPKGDAEAAEAWGLIGRACKQLFFDAADASGPGARAALAEAVQAYRLPWQADPARHTWHGVNLLALVSRARREGWTEIAPRIDPAKLARQLVDALNAVPPRARDEWHLPTLAEVTLGLGLASGDLAPVEALLKDYVGAPGVQAFQVASTLRQFTQVWALDSLRAGSPGIGLRGEADLRRARGLADILRARLLSLPGASLQLPVAKAQPTQPARPARARRGTGDRALLTPGVAPVPIAQAVPADAPSDVQLEAILGVEGPRTFAWWQAGVAASRSVGVVRKRLGQRMGTGFLVRPADFGLPDDAGPLLLTNYHVVNPDHVEDGLMPDEAEVIFEAVDAATAYRVERLLWCSPIAEHDASLLRLSGQPAGLPPLPIAARLPEIPPPEDKQRPRVYVIGYPGGRELSISFQDNELIDHEGPPTGQPPVPGRWRVHYRAPTEGGNSGSPVFNDSGWEVIALHHSGGRFKMPRLNGQPGSYAANEGLAMATLVAAVKAARPG
ncbi:trypsin-like peptidase domain-containing protein [Ideonella sp. DXS22W]|uniref:Trypsin-like peptidase domain-containing protein n=1 Tax=Pseudaquabacterium inlustre TaxID=2984192 RepID=A0ABU9CGH0_9BURK